MYRMRWFDDFGFERAGAARSVGVAGDSDPHYFVGCHREAPRWCGCAPSSVVLPIGSLAIIGLKSWKKGSE